MYFCTFHYNNLTAKSMQSDNYFVTKTQPQKAHVPLYVYKLVKYPCCFITHLVKCYTSFHKKLTNYLLFFFFFFINDIEIMKCYYYKHD